jgi:lysophospholipid acyltransferase (LPLAT)-like uncharacterized protein
VNSETEKLFEHAPLDEYPLQKRMSIRLADLGFYALIRAVGPTVSFDPVVGGENEKRVFDNGKLPIYCLWHNRIFLCTYFMRNKGIAVLTSKSFDGDYIARFIQRFGFGAIRGSSSNGGSRALVQMIKAMRNGVPMAFTADGPRGPKYSVKPGPLIVAKKTGNPVLPTIMESRSYWTANSWDVLQFPKPFTRAIGMIGEPIYVHQDADEPEMAAKQEELQSAMDDLVSRGAEWRRQVRSVSREKSRDKHHVADPDQIRQK